MYSQQPPFSVSMIVHSLAASIQCNVTFKSISPIANTKLVQEVISKGPSSYCSHTTLHYIKHYTFDVTHRHVWAFVHTFWILLCDSFSVLFRLDILLILGCRWVLVYRCSEGAWKAFWIRTTRKLLPLMLFNTHQHRKGNFEGLKGWGWFYLPLTIFNFVSLEFVVSGL